MVCVYVPGEAPRWTSYPARSGSGLRSQVSDAESAVAAEGRPRSRQIRIRPPRIFTPLRGLGPMVNASLVRTLLREQDRLSLELKGNNYAKDSGRQPQYIFLGGPVQTTPIYCRNDGLIGEL